MTEKYEVDGLSTNVTLRDLEVFFRDIINRIVSKIDFEKLSVSGQIFTDKMQKRFGFEKSNGWAFLITSLDVIGDSYLAINFIIENPKEATESPAGGKNYLLLYGVLSAVYIQSKALLELCELFKVPDVKLIKAKFDRLNILYLRHAIAAHPTNNRVNDILKPFRISRNSINDFTRIELRDENNNFKIYNLLEDLTEYQNLARYTLFCLIYKAIKTIYKDCSERRNLYHQQLNEFCKK